jgi:hypothetical protein
VKPTTHRGVIAETSGGTVCREHGILERVGGIFCGLAAPAGQPIQLHAMALK